MEYCKIDDDNMKIILITLMNYFKKNRPKVMSLKGINIGKNDISDSLTWKKLFNVFIRS